MICSDLEVAVANSCAQRGKRDRQVVPCRAMCFALLDCSKRCVTRGVKVQQALCDTSGSLLISTKVPFMTHNNWDGTQPSRMRSKWMHSVMTS